MRHSDGGTPGPKGSFFTIEEAERAHRIHKRAIELFKQQTPWLEAVKQAVEEEDDG